MNRQGHIALAVGLALIAGTATLLARMQAMQRLGTPGVRLVAKEIFGEKGQVVGTNTIDLPERVLDYQVKDMPMDDVTLNWLPRDTTLGGRLYTMADGFGIQVNAVVMGTDRTSIHKPEYCFAGQAIDVLKKEPASVQIEKPHRYELPVMKWTCAKQVKLADGTKASVPALFVYWFVADGQLTADHNERMRWMARDLIIQRTLQRWGYISCFTVFPPGQEEVAWARIQSFLAAAVPQFQTTTGPVETGAPR